MKNETQGVKRWVAGIMLALVLLAGGSQATFAQTATPGAGATIAATTPAVTTTTVQNTRDDNGFPWGLLGLLGLAGLAGLRPHEHKVERVDVERVDRTTGTRP